MGRWEGDIGGGHLMGTLKGTLRGTVEGAFDGDIGEVHWRGTFEAGI